MWFDHAKIMRSVEDDDDGIFIESGYEEIEKVRSNAIKFLVTDDYIRCSFQQAIKNATIAKFIRFKVGRQPDWECEGWPHHPETKNETYIIWWNCRRFQIQSCQIMIPVSWMLQVSRIFICNKIYRPWKDHSRAITSPAKLCRFIFYSHRLRNSWPRLWHRLLLVAVVAVAVSMDFVADSQELSRFAINYSKCRKTGSTVLCRLMHSLAVCMRPSRTLQSRDHFHKLHLRDCVRLVFCTGY